MYAPLHGAVLPAHILFLARRDPRVRTDTSLLRSVGVRGITLETRAARALELLREQEAFLASGGKRAKPGIELLVCDEEMDDSSAYALARTLAENPFLNSLPLVVMTSTPERATALQKAGVNVIERPCTQKQMVDVLRRAMSPMRPRLQIDAFTAPREGAAPPREGKKAERHAAGAPPPLMATDLFQRGMEHLRNNEPGQAEALFLLLLERQEDHLEACLALARIQRGKKQIKAMRESLLRGAAICLRKGDKAQAASIAALLPAHMQGNKILLHEATARMEAGEYRAAALGFLDANRELPATPLHSMLARAAMLTPEPEENLRKLCAAFDGLGHQATAGKLRRRLLNYPEQTAAEETSSWLDNYPRLQEVLHVASYTTWAWRHA